MCDESNTAKWATTTWAEVCVGDIVQVWAGEVFPADLLFLSAAHEDPEEAGQCHVNTAQLDGESNLKLRKAPTGVPALFRTAEQAAQCVGVVHASPPDPRLDYFTGALQLTHTAVSYAKQQVRTQQKQQPAWWQVWKRWGPGAQQQGFVLPDDSSVSRGVSLHMQPSSAQPISAQQSIKSDREGVAGTSSSAGAGAAAPGSSAGPGQVVPLYNSALLLRGCELRNCKHIVGLVLYTGNDSKLRVKGARRPKPKAPSIDLMINKLIVGQCALVMTLAIAGMIGYTLWSNGAAEDAWYLQLNGVGAGDVVVKFLTYFLLNAQAIPISLYVSMRVVRQAQKFIVEADDRMRAAEPAEELQPTHSLRNIPQETMIQRMKRAMAMRKAQPKVPQRCVVRTMDLVDELGQITHIFSDKTGTLTCNVMELRKLSVNGVSYGSGTTPIGLVRRRRVGEDVTELEAVLSRDASRPRVIAHVNYVDGVEDPGHDWDALLRPELSTPRHESRSPALATPAGIAPRLRSDSDLRTPAKLDGLGNSAFTLSMSSTVPRRTVMEVDSPDAEPHSARGVSLEEDSARLRQGGTAAFLLWLHAHAEELQQMEGGQSDWRLQLCSGAPRTGVLATCPISSHEASLHFFFLHMALDHSVEIETRHIGLDDTDSEASPAPPPSSRGTHKATGAAPDTAAADESAAAGVTAASRHVPVPTVARQFSASSPDEEAFVAMATLFGYELAARRKDVIDLLIDQAGTGLGERRDLWEFAQSGMTDTVDGLAQDVREHGRVVQPGVLLPQPLLCSYRIAAMCEYTQARKMMSLLVHDPLTNSYMVLAKGADSTLLSRLPGATGLNFEQKRAIASGMLHMVDWSEDGFRTMSWAWKPLARDVALDWLARWDAAAADVRARAAQATGKPNTIDDLMAELEQGCIPHGATAIEDRLQEGVPETIASLSAAGCAVWMLTGDKTETAVNIAFAVQMLGSNHRLMVLTESELAGEDAAAATARLAAEFRQMKTRAEVPSQPQALIIDDPTLSALLDVGGEQAERDLATVANACDTVVACRCSPGHKRDVVRLIQKYVPHAKCLAVGDGANDVDMIGAAQVGVGIAGVEGMQAANASDVSIPEFRALAPLMLVHGRWNYERMSLLVSYLFAKNVVLTVSQFLFVVVSGYSGQKLFLEWGVQTFNVLYTALPILYAGMFDQDVDSDSAQRFPALYDYGRLQRGLNVPNFAAWILSALWESAILFVFALGVAKSGWGVGSGASASLFLMGTTLFTGVVAVTVLRLMLHVTMWNRYFVWLTVISLAIWFPAVWGMDRLDDARFFGGAGELYSSPVFWLYLVLAVVVALAPTMLLRAARRTCCPSYRDVVHESQVYLRKGQHDDVFLYPPAARQAGAGPGFESTHRYQYERTGPLCNAEPLMTGSNAWAKQAYLLQEAPFEARMAARLHALRQRRMAVLMYGADAKLDKHRARRIAPMHDHAISQQVESELQLLEQLLRSARFQAQVDRGAFLPGITQVPRGCQAPVALPARTTSSGSQGTLPNQLRHLARFTSQRFTDSKAALRADSAQQPSKQFGLQGSPVDSDDTGCHLGSAASPQPAPAGLARIGTAPARVMVTAAAESRQEPDSKHATLERSQTMLRNFRTGPVMTTRGTVAHLPQPDEACTFAAELPANMLTPVARRVWRQLRAIATVSTAVARVQAGLPDASPVAQQPAERHMGSSARTEHTFAPRPSTRDLEDLDDVQDEAAYWAKVAAAADAALAIRRGDSVQMPNMQRIQLPAQQQPAQQQQPTSTKGHGRTRTIRSRSAVSPAYAPNAAGAVSPLARQTTPSSNGGIGFAAALPTPTAVHSHMQRRDVAD